MDVLTDLRGDNIVYRGGVLIQKLEDWKNYWLLQVIEAYDLCDIYNADEISLFLSLQPSNTFTFWGDLCYGSMKSKQWVAVLLMQFWW
jgi:hypothetical protein